MKEDATISSALEARIDLQKNQTLDLNEWIFGQLKINLQDHILELCCGTGAQTGYFSRMIHNGQITCVDINEESVFLNRKRNNDARIIYKVSDIDDVDHYTCGNYDLIFCAYGFYYSKNPYALHAELSSKLNPEGRFVLVGPTKGNNKELYRLVVDKLGLTLPKNVLFSSEIFMLDFLNLFMKKHNTVKFSRAINQIPYSTHDALLEYWKNTTFYTPGFDKEFLAHSSEMFIDNPIITKSIALLEVVNR